MKLLPVWQDRIQKLKLEPAANRISYGLKKSWRYYAKQINFIETASDAHAMLEFALQRRLSHIGFDTEFSYDRSGIAIDSEHTDNDPRSIRPLLLSLAMAEPFENETGRLYVFVVDLRNPEVLPVLNELFRLPATFAGHFIKVELFCLWRLGLPEPNIVWDTFVFEKAKHLGRHHHKYNQKKSADTSEQIQAKGKAREKQNFKYSLVVTCQRYGVAYRMEAAKKRLQKSFLAHSKDDPFTQEQIEYAAEDAIAACRLYPLQIQKAVQQDLHRHCQTVEMPWVITNARIEWNGVRVDRKKCNEAIGKISKHQRRLEEYLANEYGIENTRSHKQLTEFFKGCGLLHKFTQGGKVSFEKEILKKNADLHPSIALLRAARRASALLADKLLSPDFVGEDGRIRADHRQLGADTGRQTTRWPNFLGLDQVLRPMVIPEYGYGIGEVDWSQVEVGVAAAMYGDEDLVQMFNSGDVYSAMAQHFFWDKLSKEDSSITGKEFKSKHKTLRNQMKICTLGIIFGITSVGLSQNLGTTKGKAETLQKRFMNMFPRLQAALDIAAKCGAIRGYAYAISGVKRYRGKDGDALYWERNWLKNHPVQGSAAVVFKAAGNRLDKLYQQYGAKIIVALHDAFIFEAPMNDLEKVAELTSRVMCDTLQEYFPVLRPQVEVNISKPDCWNKDGDDQMLNKWFESLDALMKDY